MGNRNLNLNCTQENTSRNLNRPCQKGTVPQHWGGGGGYIFQGWKKWLLDTNISTTGACNFS